MPNRVEEPEARLLRRPVHRRLRTGEVLPLIPLLETMRPRTIGQRDGSILTQFLILPDLKFQTGPSVRLRVHHLHFSDLAFGEAFEGELLHFLA